MESCPHCNFLVRDGARTCGVCHRPVAAEASPPDFAGPSGARVAPSTGGASVAVMALMALLILFGAGAGLAAATWP